MALQFQTVPIAFTQGADTRTQSKLVVPGKWDELLNQTLSDDNTPRTRPGHISFFDSVGNGLALYQQQLLALSGGAVSTVALQGPTATASPGRRGYVGISKAEVRRSTAMQDSPDCATGGGFTLYVWQAKNPNNSPNGVNCTLVDETTGAPILSDVVVTSDISANCPRAVFAGGAYFIFYNLGGPGRLACRVILAALPSLINAETILINSASYANGLNFDAVEFGTGLSATVVYGWNDGTTSVQSIQVEHTAGIPAITAGPTNIFAEADLPVATLTGLAVAAFSDAVTAGIFAISTGGAPLAGLAAAILFVNNNVIGAPAQLDSAVAATTSPSHVTACINDNFFGTPGLQAFWDRQSEWSTNALSPLKTVTVGASGGGPVILSPAAVFANSATFGVGVKNRGPQGPFIAGKAFHSSGVVFLPVFVGSVYSNLSSPAANPRNNNSQNTFFVLESLAGVNVGQLPSVVVAKAIYGTYGLASINGDPPGVSTPCSVVETTPGQFAIVATELTLLVVSNGINISPTGVVRLNMAPNFTTPAIRTQLGETAYFAGGSLTGYDGSALSEQGFPLFPEGPALTANGAATGGMDAGVHQVVFIYEWIDNAGQRHQSAPSLPISITTVATDSLSCEVPSLFLSQKQDIQVVAYMTQAGGLTFNRVLLNGAVYLPAINNKAATTTTLTISSSDAAIAGNELLYTQPNQAPTTLANVAPNPCSALCVAQNRLFFDKADQPFQWGYSQEYINNVGLQFSPDLSGSVPADSGGIVAFAPLDEKVIIFCERRIYAIYGTGPTPSGSFNNYSRPQDIQADVGCSEALSVLSEFPDGIIFKSAKGWHLLGRDLSVKYIGDGVKRFDSNAVTAAVLLEDEKECRFVTSGNAGGLSGTTLVYSYLVGQWSWFSQTNGEGYLPVDGIWWPALSGGRYMSISLTNGINVDTPGAYTDAPGVQDPVGILTRARTAWLHLSQLEGFQRVRRLYFSATAIAPPNSTLTISVDYDDAHGLVAPGSYNASTNLFTDFFPWSGGSIDVRHRLRRQKCKSIAFTFTEAAVAGADRMDGIQALALEIGAKNGVNKLSAQQTVK